MTTITLEIPDELAANFKLAPAALSALIRSAVTPKPSGLLPRNGINESSSPIYQEVTELLTSGPNADQVLAFKISDSAQERLEELLHKNNEDDLSAEEKAELTTYLRLSEYLTKLKTRARAGQPIIG